MRGAALVLLLAAGCATGASPELLQARAAYARAAAGPAARETPALLQAAKSDLDAAEVARGAEGRHRAYLALRRAETAEVSAQGMLLVEQLNHLDHQLAALQHGTEHPTMTAESPVRPASPEPTHTVTIDKVVAPEIVSSPALAASPTPAPPAPAPAAADEQALNRLAMKGNLQTTTRGLEVTLPAGAMFVAGVASLSPGAEPNLEDVAGAVRATPGREPIVLEVHTTEGPNREAQLLLSQQRAETVRSFLIAHGVDPERVIARGVGSDRPLGARGGARATADVPALPAGPGEAPGEDRLAVILPSRPR